MFANYGIKFHFVDLTDSDALISVLNENTKLVWIETPTNPMMKITDIKINLIEGANTQDAQQFVGGNSKWKF